MTPFLPSALRTLLALAATLSLGGCGYTIHGRVVRGEMSLVQWAPGDGRIDGEPVEGAVITIVRDPQGMTPTEAGRATSGPDGTFALTVSGFGAGWMEEVWLIRAAKGGGGSAETIDRLPGSPSGQTLVVSLGKSMNDVHRGASDALWRGEVGKGESAQNLVDEMKRYR